MPPKTEYRICVVGVFTNDKGELLVGNRADIPDAWQIPQGGVDPGESNLVALFREMEEEIGSTEFEILRIASRPVKYTFPSDVVTGAAKNYAGQSLQWFLLKFRPDRGPVLEKSDGEFKGFGWRAPKDVLDGIVAWKRQAYREGLTLLGVEV